MADYRFPDDHHRQVHGQRRKTDKRLGLMNAGGVANTISARIILESELISVEDLHPLLTQFNSYQQLTAAEILEIDLPARNRVDALLRCEFFEEKQLRELACDFTEHTLFVFERRSTHDTGPQRCVDVARLYLEGVETLQALQETIVAAIPAVWQFEGTKFISAFEAGLAATFLGYKDAAETARLVARHTQRAAHRNLWESRKSNVEPMTGIEREAAWQLKRITKKLFKI